MGKKSGCCKKSSSTKCDDSSSSSSCSSYSSSTYGYCCTKYPKCRCIVNKCAPIYYPNNSVGQYPCNPCKPPCPPYPCPPYPVPTTPCSPTYNSYNSIITGSPVSFNLLSQYTLYIVNTTDSSGNLYLPSITSLSACSYNKMFVISNIGYFTITINPSTTTTTTDNINGLISITISPYSSVNVYSSYISGVGYWSLVS